MNILAASAEELTVVILCISVLVLTLVNAVLVVSLQRRNKKMNKRAEKPAPEEDKPSE